MGTRDDFVHLHVHTEYSMLDGAARVPELFDAVEALDQPAVAITDHGVLFGLVDFFREGTERGIKPILGCELYQATGSRFDRPRRRDDEPYYHLTALAADDTGYRNLIQLSTKAYLEGFFYKPRVDRELLAEHSEGIIVLSGCLGSEIDQALVRDDYAAAREATGEFVDVFGRERFFIELQDHGIDDQAKVMPGLLRLADEFGLRTVATNDSHYTRPEDADAHDALLCIQTNSQIDDEDRFRFKGTDYYVKSGAEMRQRFADVPEACDTTLDIAQMCDAKLEFGLDLLPRFPTPEGVSEEEALRRQVVEGAHRRYGDPLPAEVEQRLEHELSVIAQMGFPAYFLIVADLCRYARENGIRVGPGRGSAGGSAVAYCTGITNVDPIRYGLIFERFLNPDRISMPDIDIDFDDRRRGDMIRYAADRYGEDRVAQIVTFSTIKAKSAVRDAARVLGKPFALGDRLCKAMPQAVLGREASLGEALEQSAELREHHESDPDAREVLDTASKLEGLRRQHSIHAAAVVIGARPLVETVPLLRTDRDEIVTQYEMHGVEALGLLKMDFLGLRNLTVISDTEEHIRDNRGEDVDVDRIPLDDPATFEMLGEGDTLGVFQLDSSGMQGLVRLLRPDSFEDIMALMALYRPGPLGEHMHVEYAERKHGRRDVTYDHPDLKPILSGTYGIIVYQEQVLRMAVDIAGYSMGEADMLRKAMGKKIPEVMASQRQAFVDGAVAKGYQRRFASHLFDQIEKFAGYGFNKAHSCWYGLVSYQTAWLKANYPVEYMAALLTSVKNNKDRLPLYLAECRRMGITVLPPDVNESLVDFTPRGDDIRFGLSAVRGVGEGAVEAVIGARREHGRFEDFRDFCAKVDAEVLNKRILEALIKAGAFTSFGNSRKGLLDAFEPLAGAALSKKRAEAEGQFSLFEGADDRDEAEVELDDGVVITDDEYPKAQLLAFEREMLGLYVSDHPLSGAERLLAQHADTSCAELRDRSDGDVVTVAGVLTTLQKRFTRKGDPYLIATLEDLEGAVETVFWPRVYKAAHEALTEDSVLIVVGRVEARDESVKLAANEVVEPDLSEVRGAPVVVSFELPQCTPAAVQRLRRILSGHPGDVPVHLVVQRPGGGKLSFRLGDGLRVARRPGLFGELKAAFGPDTVSDPGGARTFSPDA